MSNSPINLDEEDRDDEDEVESDLLIDDNGKLVSLKELEDEKPDSK